MSLSSFHTQHVFRSLGQPTSTLHLAYLILLTFGSSFFLLAIIYKEAFPPSDFLRTNPIRNWPSARVWFLCIVGWCLLWWSTRGWVERREMFRRQREEGTEVELV
jgi:hypothetical protein